MKTINFARHVRAVVCALGVLFGCDAVAAGYYVANGKIYEPNGQEVQVRGISHFGFNATILQPQYLWAMGWKEQIAQIKSLGFNAVRVPFVPETLYSTTPVDQLSYVDPGRNPELLGKTPLQVLDLWMAEANRVGLFIMLDFHSISSQRQYPQWWVSNPADFNLTYNKQAYTPADWKRDLAFVAKRYAHLPRFFGIDVFNEPFGEVRWTHANPDLAWKGSVEAAARAILAVNPNLLIMVQGISGNFDGIENTNIPINWGEDLQPQAYAPLNIAQDKLVFVPHTYGPDVFNKSSFGASNFPANLASHWDTLFGQFSKVHPVIPGEWGGHYGDGLGAGGAKDVTWQNAFADYMISKGMRSSFYWSYTPNSGDTGGVLDNNLQVRPDKMNLLKKSWGAPPSGASPPPPAPPKPTPTPTGPLVQPKISGFSPASGPVGTVVTVNGTGFTGVNKAWVGQTRNAVYRVISDRQVQVTIPAGATGGSIGVFNLKYAAYSATFFKVTSGTVSPPPAPPPPAPQPRPPTPTPTPSGPLQSCASIMPLGDSITLGVNGGYRNDLYTGLQQNNCGVAFVGTQSDQNTRVADRDHEGHSGLTIGDIAGSVNTWIATTQPNIILLMIGTNDTAWWTNENADQIGTRHNALIEQLRIARPTAWIFVASIPPQSSSMIHGHPDGSTVDRAVLTQQFDAVIRNNVNARASAGQRVRFVDVNSVLTTADLYDGIHPTEAAHAKIARKFLEGIRAVLGSPSPPAPQPTPSPQPQPQPGAPPQPGISNFSPTSGGVGTVVTINGAGFTGVNQAWVGNAHGVSVRVISDSQVQVTIPAGGTTGAIGIFNSQHAAFTATSFTMR